MKGHEMIDIEVVHRWDDASLKMLYSHYYKALVAFSAQMVEHQEAAEELVQDAFVSLWQQRNTFQSAATLRAYLYNTVRNKSISWLRHERVERSRIEAFERDFRPPRLRQVFLMAIEGKTSADIAAELGVALETVKKQRQRGLKHLRRMLAPEAMLLFFVLAD